MSGFTLSAYPRIEDLMWRVRQGRVASSDAYLQNKFGYNDSITSGSEEDIWSVGGTRSDLSAAETMNIHQQQIGLTNATWTITSPVGLAIPEKSVIKFVSDSYENGSSCSVFYSGVMVSNSLMVV